MKLKLPLSFIVIIVLLLASCSSKRHISVKHINELEQSESGNGFYYSLPKTVLNIDVVVKKTKGIPGPFVDYANYFLGIDNVINNSYVDYEISDIQINRVALPDPDHYYFVEYNRRAIGENDFVLNFSEPGILKSINILDEDEIIKKTNDKQLIYSYELKNLGFNHFLGSNHKIVRDTIVDYILVDTILQERRRFELRRTVKDNEERAEELADVIIDLRNQKMDIISGFHEIPYSEETMRYMYSKLDSIKQSYLKLFVGKEVVVENTYRFAYDPKWNHVNKSQPVFRFHRNKGLLSIDENEGLLYEVNLKRVEEAQLPIKLKTLSTHKQNNNGLFYRVPEYYNVSIGVDDRNKIEKNILINQLGTVLSLPPYLFEVNFCTETGSIKFLKKVD